LLLTIGKQLYKPVSIPPVKGNATFALYGVAKTGKMPESTDTIVKFLVAGMTLFAPYVVN
jgi:hypothetical protein